jgi:hypothetical protein
MRNCVEWAASLRMPTSAKRRVLGENAVELLKL